MLKPAALDELGVESTTTAPTDPSFYFYEAWCPMTATQNTESLHNMNDVTGIVYPNTVLESDQSLSSENPPIAHIRQNGARASEGPSEGPSEGFRRKQQIFYQQQKKYTFYTPPKTESKRVCWSSFWQQFLSFMLPNYDHPTCHVR